VEGRRRIGTRLAMKQVLGNNKGVRNVKDMDIENMEIAL
jgi:hypothetical protein